MEIFLNGEPQQVADNCNLLELIENLRLETKRLAVEINLAIIPRSQFDNYTLVAGDKVEIVHAIGGG
jgi:thiamine biosynthesis protein ThiS